MKAPRYVVNAKAEGGWLAVSAAVGGLALAIASALGADPQLAGAVGVAVGAVTRFIGGALLPSS